MVNTIDSTVVVETSSWAIGLRRRSFLQMVGGVFASSIIGRANPVFGQGTDFQGEQRLALPMDGATSLDVSQSLDLRTDLIGREFTIGGDPGLASAKYLDNVRIHAVRAEDRLDLIFDLVNLRISRTADGGGLLSRIDRNLPGQIRVLFPGQHLLERVFFDSSGNSDPLALPPVETRLAGPTRLVFNVVGDADDDLPLSLETLLDWGRFQTSLTPSPVATSRIRMPDAGETSIEAPFGLFMSPVEDHAWRHASTKIGKTKFREIWHTSLYRNGSSTPTERQPAEIAAVFSRRDDPPAVGRISITARDRSQLVTLTHDANGFATPIVAKNLTLSSAGAFLNYEGRFPYDCHSAISLEAFDLEASSGQDTGVNLSRRAHLYPFGHLVNVLEITTREQASVEPTPGSGDVRGGYLRQRLVIAMTQREVVYDGAPNAAELPFRRITIDIPQTPPLDEPIAVPASVGRADGSPWGRAAFWPYVAGAPLNIPFTAEDWQGNTFKFEAPVIAVEFDASAADGIDTVDLSNPYFPKLSDVQNAHRNSGWGLRPITETEVAVSPPTVPLNTTVTMQAVHFDAEQQPDIAICPLPVPLFRLTVPRIQSRLPMLRGLQSDAENTGWFRVVNPSVQPSELFLLPTTDVNGEERKIPVGTAGQTEKSGGFAAVSLFCGGVSRKYGVVGSSGSVAPVAAPGTASTPSPIEQGQFDPLDYLGGDSTICGSVKFQDILQRGLSVAEAHMPRIARELQIYPDVPSVLRQSIDWRTEQFQSWPQAEPIFASQQQHPDLVPDRSRATALTLSAHGSVELTTPPAVRASVRAELENFGIQLVFKGNGVLIRFESIVFVSGDGGSDLKVNLDSVELVGAALKFIAAIQELLGGLLEGTGLTITLKPTGLEIGLPSFNLPSLSLGAFTLQNLRISSSVAISFRSSPTLFKFDFSSEESPFLLSMGIYGGGGFASLVIDTKHIVLFKIGFCFGAFTTLSLGIASGSAGVLGGVTYTAIGSQNGSPTAVEFKFWIRAYGSVRALGIVTVGVDFYMELKAYEQGAISYCSGFVSVSYSVKIGFFKKSFTLTYTKQFSGSQRSSARALRATRVSPTTITKDAWREYRRAFAA